MLLTMTYNMPCVSVLANKYTFSLQENTTSMLADWRRDLVIIKFRRTIIISKKRGMRRIDNVRLLSEANHMNGKHFDLNDFFMTLLRERSRT